MNHTVITYKVDIATYTTFDEHDLLMAFDEVLAARPEDIEDWKTTVKKEVRPI